MWSGVRLYASLLVTPPLPTQPSNAPRTGVPSTVGVPSSSCPRAVGCRPVPPFAVRRPELITSSSSDESAACANGILPCSVTRFAPGVLPSVADWKSTGGGRQGFSPELESKRAAPAEALGHPQVG